jgi:hypothetical protein
MGRMKADPRYNIISLRICGDEYSSLKKISRAKKISVSELMREAVQNLIYSFREPPVLAGEPRGEEVPGFSFGVHR